MFSQKEKIQEEKFELLRREMVQSQLERRNLKDQRVLEAMRKVPRHRFVPEQSRSEAYDDHPLPIGEGQTISQPYMVAIMTELLELRGGEKVLEIGTGSGYQLAILAELAREVFSVERLGPLADRSRARLRELGYRNIEIRTGDGTIGWPERAPFDGIIVTAGAPKIPLPLVEQLSEGGRLVIPVGEERRQELYRVVKEGGGTRKEYFGGCVFVPLVGEHGWDVG
ncbi:MAG: protein-L-isoaspartate(D-aspartate) O-methyltransferase [Proteobacteria bacterium]|nr:protein-L-isoaspartate(D-aspartate) O-methyltransferase [Pseudomonadota bacterium]